VGVLLVGWYELLRDFGEDFAGEAVGAEGIEGWYYAVSIVIVGSSGECCGYGFVGFGRVRIEGSFWRSGRFMMTALLMFVPGPNRILTSNIHTSFVPLMFRVTFVIHFPRISIIIVIIVGFCFESSQCRSGPAGRTHILIGRKSKIIIIIVIILFRKG